jgi:hypothetical protein
MLRPPPYCIQPAIDQTKVITGVFQAIRSFKRKATIHLPLDRSLSLLELSTARTNGNISTDINKQHENAGSASKHLQMHEKNATSSWLLCLRTYCFGDISRPGKHSPGRHPGLVNIVPFRPRHGVRIRHTRISCHNLHLGQRTCTAPSHHQCSLKPEEEVQK